MIEQKEVKINEDTYLLTQFGGMKGLKYGKRVGRILLPIMSVVFSGDGEEVSMGRVIDVVVDNLDELDEDLIVKLVTEGVTKNGVQIDFDKEFAGNYDTLVKLLQEIVQFNFQSLFQLGLDGSEAE